MNHQYQQQQQPHTLTLIEPDNIDQMPPTPHRASHHRRAQSETFFRYPEDLLFDADIDFNLPDVPSLSEENHNGMPMSVDCGGGASDESNGGNGNGKKGVGGGMSHFRSLSVDADFFEGLGFNKLPPSGSGPVSPGSFELDSMEGCIKKAMPKDKLAELSLIDPKRAKRILANRQSAARSKERKIRYTGDLERKLHTLQTEATTLSAQVTILQRDEDGLRALNNELKLRLQVAEQEAHLRDALNEALKDEVRRLKIESGECSATLNNSLNRGPPRPYFSQSQQAAHHFNIPQTQQQHNVLHQGTMDFQKMVLK